ncbi:MAG: N-acetylmuramoyl-L-alanine amidase [Porticoccaceae bacterium]|nr:N-acetylmuramoyl-L-alanine amidase [Porticoccaceae bacterium]
MQFLRQLKIYSATLVCLTLLSGTIFTTSVSASEINSVRLSQKQDTTRIVFDINGTIGYKVFQLDNPKRLVIDIANVQKKPSTAHLKLKDSPINEIRVANRNTKDLRIVLVLKKAITSKHFTLKANEKYSSRLVVDLFDKNPGKSRSVKEIVKQSDRKIVIAIDAGHGGVDPGALGPNRMREKIVVLQISKRLENLFDKDPNYEGVLIRSGDYFLAHRKRTQIARDNKADFFVSIHADAFTDPRANGASVYALSNKGATSEAARFLAKKQNNADLIGGATALNLDNKDEMLAGVLLDLSMTATMSTSLEAGKQVLKQMGSVARLHKKKVEQAGFLVLKSPDIPSLLIETGFISNPKEARKLSSGNYQQRMAKAIYNGLDQYYSEHPPEGTLLAKVMTGKPLHYVVARGDTLSEISAQYKISMIKIMRYNKMSSSKIRVGQVIAIPGR